uniref:Uncharacterized protein n=1 Tax=Strongyloides venezuelensis TaxID=75913 RepID=A0A0K0FPF0_STRVS
MGCDCSCEIVKALCSGFGELFSKLLVPFVVDNQSIETLIGESLNFFSNEIQFEKDLFLHKDVPRVYVIQIEKCFEDYYVKIKIELVVASLKFKEVRKRQDAKLDNSTVKIKQNSANNHAWRYCNLSKNKTQWFGPYTVACQN